MFDAHGIIASLQEMFDADLFVLTRLLLNRNPAIRSVGQNPKKKIINP